jgi:uncharacterized membrane protein
MTTIDQLLSQPLADIADDNFSDGVMKRIEHYQRWRQKVLTWLSLLLTALLFALFPVSQWLLTLLEYLSSSAQLSSQLFSENIVNDGSTIISMVNTFTAYTSKLTTALLSQITIVTILLLLTVFGFLKRE